MYLKVKMLKISKILIIHTTRCFAECATAINKKGLVLGAYDGCSKDEIKLTPSAKKFDEETGGKLNSLLQGGAGIKKGTAIVLSNIHKDFHSVAIAGLGPEGVGYSEAETLDLCKENIRWAAGIGAAQLHDEGVNNIFVEAFTNAESAAEGASLAVWANPGFKKKDGQRGLAKLELYDSTENEEWARGILKAECQNLARKLEEAPSNHMTPLALAQEALEILCPCGVEVNLREKDWIETRKMNAFLTMAKGSCDEPIVLELGYCGSSPDDKPITFIGKGITFDSGGLCLKECEGMSEYRGDMAGAAVLIGMFKCVSSMALPINVRAIIPLCANMIGGMAMRPGDIVTLKNGKSVAVEDTDNEGRVIMLDALLYSTSYTPCLVGSIATMTPGIRKAIGGSSSGAFSTSDAVWRELNRAGAETGDRVWRLPFWKYFSEMITNYSSVDVNNVGHGDGGGPCLAAAFLLEFAPKLDFLHLDITGTGMLSPGIGHPYLRKGLMSGRPTRTLVQFLYQLACPHEKGDEC